MLNVTFTKKGLSAPQATAIFFDEQLKMDQSIIDTDHHYQGAVSKTIMNKAIFSGKFGQVATINTHDKHGELHNLILVGIGNPEELEQYSVEQLGGLIYKSAVSCRSASVGVALSAGFGKMEQDFCAALIAGGASLAAYKFDKYFTRQKEEEKFAMEKFEVATSNEEATEKLFAEQKAIAHGVFLARDCISEPANILYPESYATKIIDELEHLGVEIEVLSEREMRNLNMGALLGVGQGSQKESKLVIMKYIGTSKDEAPISFVGKGVTFDTGGISLKPANGMWDMKYDMGGSASVVGAMKALALRGAKVNAIGVVGLVENMPGSNAQRPGDVVHTMSGQTIEVLNTDAEGRLVLADAMWYTQEKFKPKCLIDLATLTGAITVALGSTYAGCFSNDDELANKVMAAGSKVDEKLWRLPLHKEYEDLLKSDIADIANISSFAGGLAGSSTAAQFLGRFIKDNTPWVHIDIAGMAWNKKGNHITPKGAVGFGVRLLNQFVKDNYESE